MKMKLADYGKRGRAADAEMTHDVSDEDVERCVRICSYDIGLQHKVSVTTKISD